MVDIATFSNSAKNLSRNPLGIIALFIVLIYGFAALTLGVNSTLQANERLPLVWFLVLFPVVVLFTFGWLVSHHHEKLYAPADYKSDEGFLRGMQARGRHTAEVQAQQDNLKIRVREAVVASSDRLDRKDDDGLIERLTEEIDRATTITIDARDFTGDTSAQYVFPVAAFENLNDLTDEVYFKLEGKVRPFEYGHSWVMRNHDGGIVRNARMITRTPAGKPLPDLRTLAEVGIRPGSRLSVERPRPGI